jgi:hypothetical protein
LQRTAGSANPRSNDVFRLARLAPEDLRLDEGFRAEALQRSSITLELIPETVHTGFCPKAGQFQPQSARSGGVSSPYSHKGRRNRNDREIMCLHKYAIAFFFILC